MAEGATRAGRRKDDAILAGVERRGWALLSAASILAFALSGSSAAGGVILGGALGLLNFRVMKLYVSRVLRRGHRPPWWIHVGYSAKFGVVALLLAAAFRYGGPHPLGVFAGFSVLVVTTIWTGLAPPRGADKREVVHPLKTMGARG